MSLNTTTGAPRARAAILGLAIGVIGLLAPGLSQAVRKLGEAAAAQGAPMQAAPAAAPIPIKVVVVSMYQIGKLTDDKPGEAHLWVERQKLNRALPFPLGEYELRIND